MTGHPVGVEYLVEPARLADPPAGTPPDGEPRPDGGGARPRLPVDPGGVLIGRDRERVPVTLPVFRTEPTYLVLIGGLWAARIVVFRCLALGARVVIHTADPRRWYSMDEAATGGAGRIHLATGSSTVVAPASPEEPALYLADGVPAPRAGLTAWQSLLHVAPTLTVEASAALREAHAALLQRMWPQECAEALEMCGAEGPAGELASIRDDVLAVVAAGGYLLAGLAPTQIEQAMFGPPSRQ